MRTLPIKLLCQITVITKHLKSFWIIMRSQPSIYVVSSSHFRFPTMFCPIIIDMVNTQKWFICQSATSAPSAISNQGFMSYFMFITTHYSLSFIRILLNPHRSIILGIKNCFFSMFLIIKSVLKTFRYSLFWRRWMCLFPKAIIRPYFVFPLFSEFGERFFSHNLYYTIKGI